MSKRLNVFVITQTLIILSLVTVAMPANMFVIQQ